MREKVRSFDRSSAVNRQRRALEKLASPRLSMGLIAALTAASGLFASWLLLQCGLLAMWLRYPAAVVLSYGAFLFLLWCWLQMQKQQDPDAGELADIGYDLGDTVSRSGGSSPNLANDSSGIDLPDIGDGEGALIGIVIVGLLALGAALLAAFSIISLAPVLLAELLVDVALAAGLYRHVRKLDRDSHWLGTALRHTAWRFGAVALVAALAGLLLAWLAPGAVSLGDLLH
ncbi:hypothetical protein [Tahibacter harae]|uniref:Uncharacterized protein n=1 Tax=Tahibacter harae TaxID=2963937 RepID=A0ABT1QXK0_9GAMM|nr:hypothetical protein [Tahibacter harae]MCQ4167018.1 hypothetical protein [Tahibacter harae]